MYTQKQIVVDACHQRRRWCSHRISTVLT